MATIVADNTYTFALRAEGRNLLVNIEEANDVVGHSHLIQSAHHYARTIGKTVTIHHHDDRHIITVEPGGAVICEGCGEHIGSCICEPDEPEYAYETEIRTDPDEPTTPSLLSLIRQLIDAHRKTDAAVAACDNHYQAGYDRGYAEQYHQESNELRRTYLYWSNSIDHIEQKIYDHLGHDGYDFSRARHIASKHA